MYQCINSPKCISIYRLMDSVNDCPDSDDEHENRINNTDLQELFTRKILKCPGRNKYVLLLRAFLSQLLHQQWQEMYVYKHLH